MTKIEEARVRVLEAEIVQKQLYIDVHSGVDVSDYTLRKAQASVLRTEANEKIVLSTELLKDENCTEHSSNILVGDIVIFNSGSPSMTVIGGNKDAVVCEWINNEGIISQHRFDRRCVTKTKEGK